MTVGQDTGTVDTHAVVDLANGFAVVGYALFAYQQPGPINVLRPIQRVDISTPVADLVAASVAARYDEGVYETVVVETPATAVAEPVAAAPAPVVEVVVEETAIPAVEAVVEQAPAAASFAPEGEVGYAPAAPIYAEEPEPQVVTQVVVDESKRISAPTLSWDPEIWKPAAEKEAALKRLGEHGEVHGAIDDPMHAAGIAYDEPAAPAPAVEEAPPVVPAQAPAARSTVSMLQELSFLDD